MAEPRRDNDLVSQWRAGDEEAARKIYGQYVDRLLALARRRLRHWGSGRFDEEDVVQSVFRTFFHRAKHGRFQIEGEDDLCKLLVSITVHKTLRTIAAQTAAKRDPRRELRSGSEGQERLQEIMDREPTSDEAVAFLDQLEHFLKRLGPQERQILEMRLQGYGNEEIAEKLNTYDRKIRRVVERIRGMAEQEGLDAQLPSP